jgi:hypothetical protein
MPAIDDEDLRRVPCLNKMKETGREDTTAPPAMHHHKAQNKAYEHRIQKK